MNVDIESLGTVSRTAREGAERAADNLTGLTGIETAVDVTKVTLASADDLATGEERIGVTVDLSGGIRGASLLTFSREGVETLQETFLSGAADDESAIAEVGNVVTSGFVDSWADDLETTIDHSPPRYVEGSGERLLDAAGFERDRAFVFHSEVSAVGEALDVAFHLFPDDDSMQEILAGDDEIPVEKLAALREMARKGARTASESVSSMTGIDTDVDVTRLSFAPVEDVPAELSDEQYVGTVLEFEGSPGGYVLILFGEASAREVVTALVPNASPVESFDDVEQSAMEEIGNVMTSSFIDGWANVLDTTIDHSTPQFVHDMGRAIAESVVARLGQRQAEAVLFDTTLRADHREFDCDIYVLPDETELRAALDDLDPDATAERTTKAGSL
jgi:chemotaxis protein CheY-P-specific phosphatase CheC